jgi:hypothetical protein
LKGQLDIGKTLELDLQAKTFVQPSFFLLGFGLLDRSA